MSSWQLGETGRFIVGDYQSVRPFSSFLPGIAGPIGIPLWALYVNRGQAIASFGVENKDSPLMEFQPANRAYQLTPFTGFRTFLRVSRHASSELYEPFARWDRVPSDRTAMIVGANDLALTERSVSRGIEVKVLYFTVPGESFAGLSRRVTITNIGSAPASLEILDGLPALIPYGVSNTLLKELGRTIEAWMEVCNHDRRIPFYRLRATVKDGEEVGTIRAGHFAFSFAKQEHRNELLPAVVDPMLVFEHDTSLQRPLGLCERPLATLLEARQITSGRTPCALFGHHATLGPGGSVTMHAVYGHAERLDRLEERLRPLLGLGYLDEKFKEAEALAESLTAPIATRTSTPMFDAYCRQCLLDNSLRGGFPLRVGKPESSHVYYLYTRKHGDLERDYNAFALSAEAYSQGEGSYRDVNQNRRENVLFAPEVGDFDVRTFVSLLQTDGYNPRVVAGTTFTLPKAAQQQFTSPSEPSLCQLLSGSFTLGRLHRAIAEMAAPSADLFDAIVACAEPHLEATFHEGYWVDHWVYNLDLIDSYLSIYPDKREHFVHGEGALPYFDSPAVVLPRSRKYVLAAGAPRQFGSVRHDPDKVRLIASRDNERNWSRSERGKGEVYRTSLFAKLATLATVKYATLDPAGLGIEMEAGRPGWYDALTAYPACSVHRCPRRTSSPVS